MDDCGRDQPNESEPRGKEALPTMSVFFKDISECAETPHHHEIILLTSTEGTTPCSRATSRNFSSPWV